MVNLSRFFKLWQKINFGLFLKFWQNLANFEILPMVNLDIFAKCDKNQFRSISKVLPKLLKIENFALVNLASVFQKLTKNQLGSISKVLQKFAKIWNFAHGY